MKIYFLLAFIFIQPVLMSQDTYKFKTSFLPNSHFLIETSSISMVEQDYSGDVSTINKIKESGIKLPIKMRSEYLVTSLLTTKHVLQEKGTPFNLEFTKAYTLNEYYGQKVEKDTPLLNVIAIGSFDKEGKMTLDSINKNNRTLSIDSLSPQIHGFMVNISFPDRSMKVGDKFTQESPIEIPIKEIGLAQLILHTTYTLSNIKNGIAFFNIMQVINLDPKISQPQIKANGKGLGKAFYDLNTNVISDYQTIWTIDINANSSNLTLLSKMQTDYNQTITYKK